MLRFDTIQLSPQWEKEIYDIEKETYDELKGESRGMGFCFMYWSTKSASSRRKVNGIPDDAKTVLVKGYVMTVILEGLEFDTEYCCVAFVTTSEGESFYGEPQIFRTGPADPDGIEEIDNEELRMKNEGVWYSLDGKKLSKPQKGINIIRYSDGTSRKVLVK